MQIQSNKQSPSPAPCTTHSFPFNTLLLWCEHLCSDTKETWWKLVHQNKIKPGKFSSAVQHAATLILDWHNGGWGAAVVGKTAVVRTWGTVSASVLVYGLKIQEKWSLRKWFNHTDEPLLPLSSSLLLALLPAVQLTSYQANPET